jgi:glycerate 2-kinase
MSDHGPRATLGVQNRDTLVDHGNRAARELLVDLVDGVFDTLRPAELLADVATVEDGVLTIESKTYDLGDFEDVYLVGSGKGSQAVVEAISELFETDLVAPLVVEKRGQARDTDDVRVLEADHPVPSPASERAGEAVLDLADEVGPDDLVLVAVTGGTSALLAAPPAGIDTADLASVTDQLLREGAPIEDLNTVRKHLSRLKGGRLAERLAPATVVGLIVVDEVAGEPWGPTVPDRTSPTDAQAVVQQYDLREAVPASVRDHLDSAATDVTAGSEGTPSTLPSTVHNLVLADGTDACEAAARLARDRGYKVAVLSTTVEGESREVAQALASIATEIAAYDRPVEPPCVLISGGETTVTVPDDAGEGGPNQEFALACAARVAGRDIAVTAVGTDGTDGPTDAAGGLVDGATARRARERDVDIADTLRRHDSTTALQAVDDAMYTSAGTNVMDIRLFYVGTDGTE